MNKLNPKIKFACVEYSTKSGKIWQGTSEKPNYLCDPEEEIDPTSFGCWTSALRGEHIPINFLRNKNHPQTLNYKINKIILSLKEKNSKRLLFPNLPYLKKFNLILFLVHSYSFQLMAKLIGQARQINPEAIFLSSIASPLGILRETWKKETEFIAFQKFAASCNYFINVNSSAQNYLESFLKTKIVYLPQFYPFEFANQFYLPREKKEKIIFIGGEMDRTDNLSGQFIAAAVQKSHPEFLIQIINSPNLNLAPLKSAKARFETIPFLNWQENLKRLAKFYLVINLDQIWTLGRLQSDCAAVGTSSIGINANNQLEFFPTLSIPDVAGIKQGIALAEKLISNPAFYNEIQTFAHQKLSENNYAKSKQKLFAIIKNRD